MLMRCGIAPRICAGDIAVRADLPASAPISATIHCCSWDYAARGAAVCVIADLSDRAALLLRRAGLRTDMYINVQSKTSERSGDADRKHAPSL
jgi:hypothetical protein